VARLIAFRMEGTVTLQRAAGSFLGRIDLTCMGRSRRTTWKPMTCSTMPPASQSGQGDEFAQCPSPWATTAENPLQALEWLAIGSPIGEIPSRFSLTNMAL